MNSAIRSNRLRKTRPEHRLMYSLFSSVWLLLVGGCYHDYTEVPSGHFLDERLVSTVKGQNMAAVKAMLGEPDHRTKIGTDEAWSYRYSVHTEENYRILLVFKDTKDGIYSKEIVVPFRDNAAQQPVISVVAEAEKAKKGTRAGSGNTPESDELTQRVFAAIQANDSLLRTTTKAEGVNNQLQLQSHYFVWQTPMSSSAPAVHPPGSLSGNAGPVPAPQNNAPH